MTLRLHGHGEAPQRSSGAVCFGGFELRVAEGRLLRDGSAVEVEPRVFDLLVHFAGSEGRLVSKQEMVSAVWEGAFVTDGAIARAVARLRQVLGDDPRRPKYIETVHSRGYRFIARLNEPAAVRPGRAWWPLKAGLRAKWTVGVALALLLGVVASHVRIRVDKAVVDPSEDRVTLLEVRFETLRNSD